VPSCRLAWLVVLASCGSEPFVADGTTSTTTTGAGSGRDDATAVDTASTLATADASTTASTATDASSTQGETSTEDASTGTPGPVVHARRITDANRHYVEMHGGWGPHLRGLMRADDDALWFVHDAGEDVEHNREIHYLRDDGEAWVPRGSLAWPGRVQQNAASLLDGDVIHSWGVDVDGARLVTCAFDIARDVGACTAVAIGGAYSTPAASNYVGAARSPDAARLVWFTTVGAAGGAGSFIYTYDYGGGYNGPVVTPLPGYNDLAYVYAAFVAGSHASLVGQAYAGAYPNGTFGALAIDVVFGQPATFTALFVDDAPVRSGADVWIDPTSGSVHALAETDVGTLAYYVKPSADAWSTHAQPVAIIDDTFRGRFVAPPGGELALVRGSASDAGLQVRLASPTGDGFAAPVDWEAAVVVDVPPFADGFDAPSAIYVESTTYQHRPVGALHFAACGRYGIADGEIWHVAITRG
jgi:hypothetical protein